MTARRTPGFDRLPRRSSDGEPSDPLAQGTGTGLPPGPARAAVPAGVGVPADADGKRALFSTAEQPPTFGSVTVACSSCQERTVVSLRRAVRLAVPSVHLPLLRPAPWSWMRCPACSRMSWVAVSVRL